jgi:hypothetical protein
MNRAIAAPAAIVRSAEDLAALAVAINAAHEAGLEATRKRLEHYRHAGELLHQAKGKVGHGNWLSWVKRHVKCSRMQANRYMQLAEVVKCNVDVTFEEQETEWRRIAGNAPAEPEDEAQEDSIHELAIDSAESPKERPDPALKDQPRREDRAVTQASVATEPEDAAPVDTAANISPAAVVSEPDPPAPPCPPQVDAEGKTADPSGEAQPRLVAVPANATTEDYTRVCQRLDKVRRYLLEYQEDWEGRGEFAKVWDEEELQNIREFVKVIADALRFVESLADHFRDRAAGLLD